jgi:hypothetical protein
LKALGYQPFTTFHAVNLQSANLCRAYASSSDPARILVTLITAPRGKVAHNYAEISADEFAQASDLVRTGWVALEALTCQKFCQTHWDLPAQIASSSAIPWL